MTEQVGVYVDIFLGIHRCHVYVALSRPIVYRIKSGQCTVKCSFLFLLHCQLLLHKWYFCFCNVAHPIFITLIGKSEITS